ncbi:MAG: hypothetical protein DMG14_28230 [Acidobacteria bacterium]|nr:MAG: hypothetical protein DMG14_28230 [Acidobacteriota bacterium]
MKTAVKILAGFVACCVLGIVSTHASNPAPDTQKDSPEAEFQMARMKYRTFGGGGSHGYFQPWWAIDYPLAEEHFFPALRRNTNIQVADEERHLEITDDRVFEYPFLFMGIGVRTAWKRRACESTANAVGSYWLMICTANTIGQYLRPRSGACSRIGRSSIFQKAIRSCMSSLI